MHILEYRNIGYVGSCSTGWQKLELLDIAFVILVFYKTLLTLLS